MNMENTATWLPAAQAAEYNPDHFDLRWNADYTAFEPVRLRWTDDASYARRQGDSDAAEDALYDRAWVLEQALERGLDTLTVREIYRFETKIRSAAARMAVSMYIADDLHYAVEFGHKSRFRLWEERNPVQGCAERPLPHFTDELPF
jgi:hypothetical protein